MNCFKSATNKDSGSSSLNRCSAPVFRTVNRPIFSTVSANEVPFRLITAFKTVGGKRYGIQIAQSLEESSELVLHFGWILIGAIPMVLLVACAAGYWMAKRALQPIVAITVDARAISALDISKRIVVPVAKDELRDLSMTLNAMMDRLETAFQRVTPFTADASHELRTPIALIRTTAELAIADHSHRSLSEALSSILEESERTTKPARRLISSRSSGFKSSPAPRARRPYCAGSTGGLPSRGTGQIKKCGARVSSS